LILLKLFKSLTVKADKEKEEQIPPLLQTLD